MLMDLPDELEQSDSGMESLTASKDDTPERKPEDSFLVPASPDQNQGMPGAGSGGGLQSEGGGGGISALVTSSLKEYEDEPDETLSERLWGLTEMFPGWMRNGTHTVTTKTWCGVKNMYSLSRTVMWIVASSSVILFAPVIFEVERAQVEEMQKSQQKQVLLGTNTISNMPPMPR